MADSELDQSNAPAESLGLERFSYDDAIVRKFVLATLVWGVVGMAVGVFIALQLAIPALNFSIDVLTFGRIRPLHTNAVIFAFAGNAIFAAVYYSTQRLCKARLYSDVLSNLHFWCWQLIIVAAAVTLPLGITQGKEYAELEWPIDIAIAVVYLGFFGVNFMMTLIKRRERHLYVSLWFYIATIFTVAILHVFNSLVIPTGLFKSYSVYAGVQDAFMQWWYGHNAVAFFLTTPFLGMMYYYLPKAAERPVFSYKLSIIHFWSLVFLYIWAGPHHLHYTALPIWASTLGMVFSLMLWMPSWGGMINGLLTLRGAWHRVSTDPVLKFFVVGITFYGMATFEGPVLSIKSINALSHYTDWTVAHVHAGALGWNGFMTFGMIYWMMPRLFQTKLYSEKLATTHFWIGTIGILLYIIPIYVAGLTQGLMWRAIDGSGNLAYPDFVETVTHIIPMYYVRALGGLCYLVGMLIMAWNSIKRWSNRPDDYKIVQYEAAPLSRDYVDAPAPRPRISGVTKFGLWLDVWTQMVWHRRWERLPIRLTVWVVIAVVVASLFEMIPTFLIRSNVPTIASVQPYTPLELYGRDIYVAEGCYNCHSQMIRPILPETMRYAGNPQGYSKPGEFVYDHPFQWGSRRIGPDLAREGGRQSDYWHLRHFKNPGDLTPNSIMPPYPWLLEREINFKVIQDRVQAAYYLGAPYTEELENAEAMARAQAKEIAETLAQQGQEPGLTEMEDKMVVALIAYIQRVGVDLFKSPPAEVDPDDPSESNELIEQNEVGTEQETQESGATTSDLTQPTAKE